MTIIFANLFLKFQHSEQSYRQKTKKLQIGHFCINFDPIVIFFLHATQALITRNKYVKYESPIFNECKTISQRRKMQIRHFCANFYPRVIFLHATQAFITRNKYVKYGSSIFNEYKVIGQVKVFVTDRQTNTLTHERELMSPIFFKKLGDN